jgi:hypothetical protein
MLFLPVLFLLFARQNSFDNFSGWQKARQLLENRTQMTHKFDTSHFHHSCIQTPQDRLEKTRTVEVKYKKALMYRHKVEKMKLKFMCRQFFFSETTRVFYVHEHTIKEIGRTRGGA